MAEFEGYPVYTPQEAAAYDSRCDFWEVDRVSSFYVDPETGQVGADCHGRSPGAVRYFSAA